jgi:hypothetical protein
MFNFPKWLADRLSYWLTRWTARNATPEQVVRQYDAAMVAVIRALDEVKESDWALGAEFYGHGFYTIADLFHTPAQTSPNIPQGCKPQLLRRTAAIGTDPQPAAVGRPNERLRWRAERGVGR